MLFFVSLLPFTTKLMSTHFESDPTAVVVIYGLDILAATLTMNGIIRSAINTPDILVDESAESELKALMRRRQFGVAIIVSTLILAFFFPKIAVAGYNDTILSHPNNLYCESEMDTYESSGGQKWKED
ncbi:MAG: hypothetical protein LUQ22_07450, partial [Methanotrichaceae archaeon]|nr:hypothetical protein [Methanotrichaceae archaeon]